MNKKLKARIIEMYGKQWIFAQKMGVHDSIVSKAITGARPLPQDQQKVWAKKLKCPVNELFP